MDQLFKNRVESFLDQKTIAIAGYSTDKKQVANMLYKKFQENGYQVLAINPKADQITEVECYPSLSDTPIKADAVMISTNANATKNVIEQCISEGIKHVWIHSSMGKGSYDKEAVELAESNGLEIIPKACPMMFIKPDGFHACFKWFMNISGKLKIEKS